MTNEHNLATFETFQALAFECNQAKQDKADTSEAFKSLTNEVAWSAFYIIAKGTKEAQEALSNAIAKDAPLNNHKGQVSKARTLYTVMQEVDILGVSLDTLLAMPSDAFPSVALSTLYKEALPIAQGETEESKRERAIYKAAKKAKGDSINVALTKKQFEAMPDKELFLADAAKAYDAAQANAPMVERAEAIAEVLERIEALGAWREVQEALIARLAAADVAEAQAA